jgi:hypothetical protein
MAERYPGNGAAANWFGRRSLHNWDARLLCDTNYPEPPNFCGPPCWRLSVNGIYIPLPLVGTAAPEEEI